jgi:hypothetical protein
MKTLHWKKLALILSLTALVACGGDDDDDDDSLENEQLPQGSDFLSLIVLSSMPSGGINSSTTTNSRSTPRLK